MAGVCYICGGLKIVAAAQLPSKSSNTATVACDSVAHLTTYIFCTNRMREREGTCSSELPEDIICTNRMREREGTCSSEFSDDLYIYI